MYTVQRSSRRNPAGGSGVDIEFFTTTFSATEDPISEGGIWLNGQADGGQWKNMRTSGGNAFGQTIQVGFDDNIAIIKNWGLTDYYVQGVVWKDTGYSSSVNHECELLGRFLISSGVARGIEALFSKDGNHQIVRWNGDLGSFDSLAQVSDIVLVDGDVMRVEFSGDSIVTRRNGNQINSATDATWADGAPGIGTFSVGGGSPAIDITRMGWRSFEAGPL